MACRTRSSMRRVRTTAELRVRGHPMSRNQVATRPNQGTRANSANALSCPVSNAAAYGSSNRRRSARSALSTARNSAMYSAVRLGRSPVLNWFAITSVCHPGILKRARHSSPINDPVRACRPRKAGAALPGDDHGHNGGLARSGGELQGHAHQLGVCGDVGVGQILQEALARFAHLRGDLGQPDGGFNGFDLAKERANVVELVVAPVLEKALRIRGDFPV